MVKTSFEALAVLSVESIDQVIDFVKLINESSLS